MASEPALRYLLDTDVVIWELRGHPPTVRLLDGLRDEGLACSVLTIYEVWRGVRPNERAVTQRVLSAWHGVPVTVEAAYQAAEYLQTYRQRGATLGDMDSVIAATAKVRGLALLTYSRRHFPMDDIELYDRMPTLE
jgi:predicted nucleic acid-binding protein